MVWWTSGSLPVLCAVEVLEHLVLLQVENEVAVGPRSELITQPPLLQPPAARRPPDAGAERESAADEARRVRSETDDAYARSLADDQRKAAQRAAEDAEAAHEQAIRDRCEAARQRLAATPEATGPSSKRVRVRLPEGLPLARSFYESDPISLVRTFVYAFGRAPDRFALVYLGPPMRTLDDDDAPLSSLGPGPVALMVTDLDA